MTGCQWAMNLRMSGRPRGSGRARSAKTGFQSSSVAMTNCTATDNLTDGYRVTGTAAVEGGNLGVVSYHIDYDGNVYHFYGLANSNTFSTYSSAMDGALRSFARLTDSRYLNRDPIRLTITNAGRTAPFSTLASRANLPGGMNMLSLAIINQVNVNETIQAGTPITLTR